MRNRSWVRALWLAIAVVVLVVPPALAATIASDNENYLLPAGEVVEGDLYAFANTVQIDGTVKGDLIAAGTTVLIGPTGVVEGDLMAAGQDVTVGGRVEDDMRAAAYKVRIESGGSVADDVLMAGFSVEAATDTQIGGDIFAAGYQGLLAGEVGGNANFGGNALQLDGQIAGDVDAAVGAGEGAPPMAMFPNLPRIETIAPGFHVGEQADIAGALRVTSPSELSVPTDVAASVKVELEQKVEAATEQAAEERGLVPWLIGAIKDYLALLLFGLLILWLAPRILGLAGEIVDARVLPSAGWGCLTVFVVVVGLIALFVATMLAFIIVGAVKIGPLAGPVFSASVVLGTLMTFGLYVLAWVAKVVAGQWIGRLILRNLTPGTAMARFGPLVLGLAIFAVLINIPNVGWLFSWLGIFIGLGALVLASRPHWPRRGGTAEAVPAMPAA